MQIQCFARLADNRKLTKTAAEFNLRPSTLSKNLDKMENELSSVLFNQTSSGFELTDIGEIVYPSFQYISQEYEKMLFEIGKFTHRQKTQIKVIVPFHQPELIAALLDFQDSHQDVEIKIMEHAITVIQELLDTAEVDLAFAYNELIEKKYSGAYTLRTDQVVAVVSEHNPLAEKESISLSELKGENFFLFKGDNLMYRYLLKMCITSGFVPRRTDIDCRMNTIMEHISHNHGVTLLPEKTIQILNTRGCVVLPLTTRENIHMTMFMPNMYPSSVCAQLMDSVIRQFEKA